VKNNIQRNLFSKFISGYKFTIANAHVNFKNELDANLSTIIAEDLSLSKINKRYLYTNLILPSSVVNQLKLAIAIDHSGSISERESREQLGVIDNILEGRVPKSWKVYYKSADGQWLPVEAQNAYGVQKGAMNEVQFKAVTTTALKLEVQLPEKYSAGIFEWEVE
jgi:predicted metal-dependent peptidase